LIQSPRVAKFLRQERIQIFPSELTEESVQPALDGGATKPRFRRSFP
jgi:hypothetical protein